MTTKSREEFELNKIARFIFNDEPRPVKSFQIQTDEADNEYTFQLVISLLLEGLTVLYGTEFDINLLTDSIFVKLNEYLNSFGFTLQKHFGKAEQSYCRIDRNPFTNKYLFVIPAEKVTEMNEIKENLSDYMIDLGDFQLSINYLF